MDTKNELIASALQIALESSDDEEYLPFLLPPVEFLMDNDDSLDYIGLITNAVQPVLDVINKHKQKKNVKDVEVVLGEYSEEDFIKDFRLSREVANKLISQFNSSDIYQSLLGHSGRPALTAEKHIISFLWFVGHETTGYRGVAERFKITSSSVHSVISRVSEFLIAMAPNVIKYPSLEEKNITKQYFSQSKGFPGVIGVIDIAHIGISTPHEISDRESYVNQNNFYSIQIQGVSNHEHRFIDVFVGYPGSIPDAKVFHESFLHDNLHELCAKGEYLLGDGAYPCTQHLMVPFRNDGHLSKEQIKFNELLKSCHDIIKETFDKLKLRFPILYHCKLKDISRTIQVIHACCILHNLANVEDLKYFKKSTTEESVFEDVEPIGNTDFEQMSHDNLRGSEIRDKMCHKIFTHS